MAFDLKYTDLKREYARLRTVLRILVWGASVAVFMFVSVAFAHLKVRGEREHLAMEVARIRLDIAPVIWWEGAWNRQEILGILRKAALADRPDDAHRQELRQVLDLEGNVVAEIGTKPEWPSVSHRTVIEAANGPVGYVQLEESLKDPMREIATLIVAVLLFIAGAAGVVLHVCMRVLRQGMHRMQSTREAHDIAEAEVQQHVEMMEKTRKELVQTTKSLEEALAVAAESSEAKSRFLASMSHELRTPLNAIIGFSECLENEIHGPLNNDRYKEYICLVLESGCHLLALVNDILDLSRVDAGKVELVPQEVGVHEVVDSILQTIHLAAVQKNVGLVNDVPDDMPDVFVDSQRFRQVLTNLVSNAIKFNRDGGEVRVWAERLNGDGVRIEVADTGVGIEAHNIAKVLDRFGRIEDSHTRNIEGTGLGLPIAKSLVEAHGGTLNLESTVGVGTCISIWLPEQRIVCVEGSHAPADFAAAR